MSEFSFQNSDKLMGGWFMEEDFQSQAENYLHKNANRTLDFLDEQIGPDESPVDFYVRLKARVSNPIFSQIKFGNFETSIESKDGSGSLKFKTNTVAWDSDRKKPGILDEILPKYDMYSELERHMYLGSVSYPNRKTDHFFIPLDEFKELSIQLPNGECLDFFKILPGYKLFAPLSVSQVVSDKARRMRTTHINSQQKYIVVDEPLNTPDGLFSLFHEIGHGYVRLNESIEENEMQQDARVKLRNNEDLDDVHRAALMEDERLATAFALKQIRKLSKYIDLPNNEVVVDAYFALATYITNNEGYISCTKQDLLKSLKDARDKNK